MWNFFRNFKNSLSHEILCYYKYGFLLINDVILPISEYEASLVKIKATQKIGQVNRFAMCII